jgi:hypothetical protein
MIDFKSFAKINPNNIMDIDTAADPLPTVDGTDEYDLSDEHLLICDYEVPGFSLADKKWCWFAVDKIRDVEFNAEAFEKLLLPQEQKDMIYSLVEVHTNKNLSFDDVIKGKGKGMVFLLHGVPGVGKTLTAGATIYLPNSCLRERTPNDFNRECCRYNKKTSVHN